MMKKVCCVLLVFALMSAVLTGCGDSSSGDVPSKDEKVLYHASASTPYVTLDPSIENSNGVMVLVNVYETLTRYNDETETVDPLIANNWTVNDDGNEWVFQLRDDVTFHDGTKLTAQNVVNSVNKTISKGGGAAYLWDSVATVEATGDYEVTFRLSYPAPIDQIASSAYSTYIISDAACEEDTEWFNAGNDGGSGPYMITQASGDTVVLKAYPEYRAGWAEDQYKNIIIKEVPESSARRQLLESGEAQIASDFSSTDMVALREETDKVDIYTAKTFNNMIICNNTQSDYMNNPDFRRALAYAFPYEDTVEHVLEGTGARSTGLVPSGLWGHSDELYQYYCDLDKAQEYLDKSGIDPSGISLVLTYANGFDVYTTWSQMFQANLKKLGINLDIRAMEWDNQWDMAKNTDPNERQDMFAFMWWPEYANPSSWFDSLVHSEEDIFFALTYRNDPEIDSMIEEATKETFKNRDRAEQIYIDVQKKLVDDCDFLFLYDMNRVYAISKSISGVHENPGYPYAINYYDITYQQ